MFLFRSARLFLDEHQVEDLGCGGKLAVWSSLANNHFVGWLIAADCPATWLSAMPSCFESFLMLQKCVSESVLVADFGLRCAKNKSAVELAASAASLIINMQSSPRLMALHVDGTGKCFPAF